MTWEDWIDHHASMFGLIKDEHMAMLSKWVPVFKHAGFTPVDMHRATDYLGGQPSPKYPGDHRDALLARARKGQRGSGDRIARETVGCALCKHTGMVDVPNLDWYNGRTEGKWYNGMVYCRCIDGVRRHRDWVDLVTRLNDDDAEKYPDAAIVAAQQRCIDRYEEINPDWQTQMAQHHAAETAQREALDAESRANVFGPLIARLRKQQTRHAYQETQSA